MLVFTLRNVKKCKDVLHCKLREFCKEASILKGYGTKKQVQRVVSKYEREKAEEFL